MSRRLAGVPSVGVKGVGVKKSRRAKSKAATPNMIAKFGQHLTLPGPEEISRIRFNLSQAGFYTVKSIPTFYAVRLVSLLLPQFVLLIYWGLFANDMATKTLIQISVALIIVGLFAPNLYLRHRIKKRKMQARDGFPDMMDLLLACIEAGLGLDAALNNVSKELGKRFPVIQVNLDLLNLELMAGRTRSEAFKNFAERLGLEEAAALNIMLKQSEEMGSSLGQALRTFSEEMRSKRMLRAEEKAMSLPAKMTVPLILFIFPTILLMLFLPAGVRLSGAFL
ncbi:MAG: type II secretion system F family protein [Robiginitomaculum sp.]|nr:type II secretion system F family protein [Robiginitomaculum sp.]